MAEPTYAFAEAAHHLPHFVTKPPRFALLRMDVVEPDVAEGVEAIRDGDGRVTGWRRNIFSYPPVGDPAGGAYTTVGDLTAERELLPESDS